MEGMGEAGWEVWPQQEALQWLLAVEGQGRAEHWGPQRWLLVAIIYVNSAVKLLLRPSPPLVYHLPHSASPQQLVCWEPLPPPPAPPPLPPLLSLLLPPPPPHHLHLLPKPPLPQQAGLVGQEWIIQFHWLW